MLHYENWKQYYLFIWFKNTPLKFSLIADSREIDKLLHWWAALTKSMLQNVTKNYQLLIKIKNNISGNIIHSLIQLFHLNEIRFCKPSKICGSDFALNICIKFQSIWIKNQIISWSISYCKQCGAIYLSSMQNEIDY